MARLTYEELLRAIVDHPEYPQWKMDVPPRDALRILFVKGGPGSVRDVKGWQTALGLDVYLEFDERGLVTGLEIQ